MEPGRQKAAASYWLSSPGRSQSIIVRRFAMPKYLIEREIPGAGNLTPQQLHAIAQKSCSVLSGLGPQIQWLESYVTGDKIYCVYIAPNARQGGFPANCIAEIKSIIDPTTAEG
jgi:hypothetical protein